MTVINSRLAWFLLIVFVMQGCGDADKPVVSQENGVDIVRQIKYGFTIANPSNQVIENVAVRVHAPPSEPGVQELLDIRATMPFEVVSSQGGASELVLGMDAMQPYRVTDVWITVSVGLSRQRAGSLGDDAQRYLVRSRYIEVDDVRITNTLSELRADNHLDSLKNIYTWIVENIEDEGYVREDRGAVYALTEKKGDCTEQMYLFMALSRALGVPARGVAGFAQSVDGVVRSGDYHNWAEVFFDGAWRVVDPLKKKFFEDESVYVAMKYLDEGDAGQVDSQAFFRVTGEADVKFK